jgi:integrase
VQKTSSVKKNVSKAIAWGKVSENPVKKVSFYRENNERIRLLSGEEEERLLAQCGPQLKPLVITALHTGFRAAELLSLAWDDVDFRRRTITIRAAYAKMEKVGAYPIDSDRKVC